jgi:xanthine dehydrogenase YagS FAD-binding subunit
VSVAADRQPHIAHATVRHVQRGGVAHKPWRATRAEAFLKGGPASIKAFRAAAEAELADARPLNDNGFKIELAARTITAVLAELAGAHA